MMDIVTRPQIKKFILPISPNYVNHWGLWEATREILQNAYDEKTRQPESLIRFDWEEDSGEMMIGNSRGILAKSSLILGGGDKAEAKELRGKFGEGYKLALLVFLRLKKNVTIYTGGEMWTPMIVHDEEYGADVLCIKVEQAHGAGMDGTSFLISDIDFNEWEALNQNVLAFEDSGEDRVLNEPNQKGRIYVGGLFVAELEEYAKGYSFKAGSVQLDRDRGMIDHFNLSYATSKLWAAGDTDEAYAMLMDRCPDVHYIESWASKGAPIVSMVSSEFIRQHGEETIPVATQKEIELAVASGKKWVMVPEIVKKLIAKVRNIFIPQVGTPLERLQKLVKENYFADAVTTELKDIIKQMGGTES